jgi:hypothetical protein
MNLPEPQRQALLRFAEFESKRFDDKDDVELMMLQLAWFMFSDREPERWKRAMVAASSLYDPNFKAPEEPGTSTPEQKPPQPS